MRVRFDNGKHHKQECKSKIKYKHHGEQECKNRINDKHHEHKTLSIEQECESKI